MRRGRKRQALSLLLRVCFHISMCDPQSPNHLGTPDWVRASVNDPSHGVSQLELRLSKTNVEKGSALRSCACLPRNPEKKEADSV